MNSVYLFSFKVPYNVKYTYMISYMIYRIWFLSYDCKYMISAHIRHMNIGIWLQVYDMHAYDLIYHITHMNIDIWLQVYDFRTYQTYELWYMIVNIWYACIWTHISDHTYELWYMITSIWYACIWSYISYHTYEYWYMIPSIWFPHISDIWIVVYDCKHMICMYMNSYIRSHIWTVVYDYKYMICMHMTLYIISHIWILVYDYKYMICAHIRHMNCGICLQLYDMHVYELIYVVTHMNYGIWLQVYDNYTYDWIYDFIHMINTHMTSYICPHIWVQAYDFELFTSTIWVQTYDLVHTYDPIYDFGIWFSYMITSPNHIPFSYGMYWNCPYSCTNSSDEILDQVGEMDHHLLHDL